MKYFTASFWVLLAIGIGLRCVAINQPLVDHGLLRQVQTAGATKSLIEQPGFSLSSRIPWLPDSDARFVLELPLYNYLVIPVFKITGNLDMSGKLTSIGLWVFSFWLLQFIWMRCLKPSQIFWANLLFAIAPLGVFYNQAFMPEALIQCLAFGFVLCTLRFNENPTLARWAVCSGIGLLGLLVKMPEIAHLYLILAILVFQRERWAALRQPRYWIAAFITIAVLRMWSHYMDQINAANLPEWSSTGNLYHFIGSWQSRFHFKPWLMIVFYLGGLVIPGVVSLAALYGLVLFRKSPNKILGLWLLSLVVFYLVWFGNTAAVQSYYNLVALAPLSALAAIGIDQLMKRPIPVSRPKTFQALAIIVIALCAVPGLFHLFKQDRQILTAARWTENHTTPDELVIFEPNHRWDMVDYPYNAIVSYYSHRPTVVWTRNTPDSLRAMALKQARYAVVTTPRPPSKGLMRVINHVRGADKRKPQPTEWLEENRFRPVARQDGFIFYEKE
jgi:hypothetical protein